MWCVVDNENDILPIFPALFLDCQTCIQNDVCFNFDMLAAVSLLQCFYYADSRRFRLQFIFWTRMKCYTYDMTIGIFKRLVIFLGTAINHWHGNRVICMEIVIIEALYLLTSHANSICNLRVMCLTLHANNFKPKPALYIQM